MVAPVSCGAGGGYSNANDGGAATREKECGLKALRDAGPLAAR